MRHYRSVITKIHESGDEEFFVNCESFELTAAKPLYEQNPLRGSIVLPTKEERKAGFTRTQVRNRNRRVRRKALKAHIKHKTEAKCKAMWVPRIHNKTKENSKLVSAKREDGVKHEVSVNYRVKPACVESSPHGAKPVHEFELDHECDASVKHEAKLACAKTSPCKAKLALEVELDQQCEASVKREVTS